LQQAPMVRATAVAGVVAMISTVIIGMLQGPCRVPPQGAHA
jgi:hypothetical protein